MRITPMKPRQQRAEEEGRDEFVSFPHVNNPSDTIHTQKKLKNLCIIELGS